MLNAEIENSISMPNAAVYLSPCQIDDAVVELTTALQTALEHQKRPVSNKDMFANLPPSIQTVYAHREKLRKRLQRLFNRTGNNINPEYRRTMAELNCAKTLYKALDIYNEEVLLKRLQDIKPGAAAFKKLDKIIGLKKPLRHNINNDSHIA